VPWIFQLWSARISGRAQGDGASGGQSIEGFTLVNAAASLSEAPSGWAAGGCVTTAAVLLVMLAWPMCSSLLGSDLCFYFSCGFAAS
jgi:hypothetical protein